jgi:hypothetical protein
VRELALTVGRVPADRVPPLAARLDPARPDFATIMAAHERARAGGEDTYVDPATGYRVFTAQALWDRGRCCDSGCRHCPFTPGARVGGAGSPPRRGQSRRGTE